MNPPSRDKYGHYVNADLTQDHEGWQAAATFNEGSWWPRWGKWLGQRAGKKIPARFPGDGGRELLGDAPGTYVTRRQKNDLACLPLGNAAIAHNP